MRAILVLYMVSAPELGGLGFDTKHATSIYGTYTMSVWPVFLAASLTQKIQEHSSGSTVESHSHF